MPSSFFISGSPGKGPGSPGPLGGRPRMSSQNKNVNAPTMGRGGVTAVFGAYPRPEPRWAPQNFRPPSWGRTVPRKGDWLEKIIRGEILRLHSSDLKPEYRGLPLREAEVKYFRKMAKKAIRNYARALFEIFTSPVAFRGFQRNGRTLYYNGVPVFTLTSPSKATITVRFNGGWLTIKEVWL